jgi:hypothetical protein
VYSAHIGRRLLTIHNAQAGQTHSPRTFFDEVFFPLFFDSERYLMWVNNSPFDQAFKLRQKQPLTAEVRRDRLTQLHAKAGAIGTQDGSILLGSAALGVEAPTSSQVTALPVPVSTDDVYLSWIGAAAGVGVEGGFSLLIDDDAVLRAIIEGWTEYRRLMDSTPNFKPHQIDTWNGWWLMHRFSRHYEPDRMLPEAMFGAKKDPSSLALVTARWAAVIFALAHECHNRALRQADHTVFCVADGQKTYWDPQFNQRVAYSSGQQVKRSILDALSELLGERRAPITFNYKIAKTKDGETLENKEPWSPCDPKFADQLIGGWMRAREGEITIKRRSPLSVSAMRPLHPLLVTQEKENLTFDRRDHPEQHPVRVLNSEGQELSSEDIDEFLRSHERTLPRRHWIPENVRTTGLFVFDLALDLRRLFRVSLNQHEPELTPDRIEELKSQGWGVSADGLDLVCPPERRERIVSTLASALLNWRVTSNQSRTYSPQAVLAVSVSDNANRVVGAIRADLMDDEGERPRVEPVLDSSVNGVELFIALPAKGHIRGVTASATALDDAEQEIERRLRAFDYEAPQAPACRDAGPVDVRSPAIAPARAHYVDLHRYREP